LHNGSGVAITNSRASPGTSTFLQLDNVQDRRVFVNYDLSAAKQILDPAGQSFTTQSGLPKTQSKATTRRPTQ
jgi:hypothetical protein